ncbi:calmodulin-binding transcription activator 5-like [Solanum dulcamara]|uniref:calmodulin-binding transcription activator 5-like n=1 Tax=Solanum dulcamara TaxID=45834 RepID=UPI0024869FB6|nr:calmodulin-binding transcription activator 5-like [Solanum dulcamara]
MQAVFRGFQVRRQYWKIIWLEKALFRWRLKRKGFHGLKLQSSQVVNHKPDDVEEDFFQASRKQAEEHIERSVVRVHAMFRSKQAQEQYRRMKLEHNKATLEYEGTLNPDTEMD